MEEKIPRKIHYCWFGGNPLPETAKKYIASWKKFCPDYEIIEWNEKNFDINCCPYVKEAYQAKKWAFVTDYVRLFVLYTYGGIYMDTDVEVIGNLDIFLNNSSFSGFENDEQIPTGIIAAEKGNLWIKRLLYYYQERHFILKDGYLDLTTNVNTITKITKANYPIKLNNTYQMLGDVTFYPKEYFCPKDFETQKIYLTNKSVTIHHFNGSWISEKEKRMQQDIKEFRSRHRKVTCFIYKNYLEYKSEYKSYKNKFLIKFIFEKIRRKIYKLVN